MARVRCWGGERIALLDLAGFDPLRPWLLDGRQTRNLRTLVSRDRVLRSLLEQYAAALIEAGHEPDAQQASYSVVDGIVADDIVQSLVRAEVLASARGRGTGLALDGRASAGTTLREWLAAARRCRWDPRPRALLGRVLPPSARPPPRLSGRAYR